MDYAARFESTPYDVKLNPKYAEQKNCQPRC
jgi:hypothetical protein